MLRRLQPEIGCWYENLEQEAIFEVVSIDDDDQTVGVQYFDGDIEVLELETFMSLALKAIDQPEDWSGPYEVDEDEDAEQQFNQYNYPDTSEDNLYQFDDFLP